MIRYFGVPVTPDSFKGSGWRYYAIRFLAWVVSVLQGWLTRLMYEVELKEAHIEAPEAKQRILEAAETDWEKRRADAKTVAELLELTGAQRGPRSSYRTGRASALDAALAEGATQQLRGIPLSESPLFKAAQGGRAVRYTLGRKQYRLMSNDPDEGDNQ